MICRESTDVSLFIRFIRRLLQKGQLFITDTRTRYKATTGGSFTFTRASKIIDLAAEGQRGPAKPRSAASAAAAGAGDATEWPACVTSGAVDVRLTSIMNGAMRGSFH